MFGLQEEFQSTFPKCGMWGVVDQVKWKDLFVSHTDRDP